MHAVLRVLPLALGSMSAVLTLRAQPAELPPIFAPRPVATVNEAPLLRRPAAGAGVSDRVRKQMTERILTDAKIFEAPTAASAAPAEPAFSADGALLMQRFVVKSIAPRPEEVNPPEVPLLRFAPVARADRRVKGYSATLFRVLDGLGLINLNVLNGAGQGVDHGRDFTRAEIEFSFRW